MTWTTHISRQNKVLFFSSLLVSTTIFFYLYETISAAELLAIIRGIPISGLLLFMLFSLMMSIFRSWRYHLLLSVSGYAVAVVPLFLITLVRNLFADLLPARLGTLVYIYLARNRLNVSWSSASASFAYSFIFDLFSLGFIILLASLLATGLSKTPVFLIGAGILLAGLSAGVLLLIPIILTWSINWIPRLPLISQATKEKTAAACTALETQLTLLRSNGVFMPVFTLSLGVRASKYLALYFLLISLVIPLGHTMADFPLPKVFFGLTAAEMAASLPVSGIAGFGAYEGAWSLVFQLLGYPEKLAALTSISHHLISQLYGYSLGALAFLVLLLPLRRHRSDMNIRTASPIKWLHFKAALLFILALAISVPLLAAMHSSTTVSSPPTSSTDDISPPRNPPAGKVVFQQPEGIYIIYTGRSQAQAKQLNPSGTYPRWSPYGSSIAFIDDGAICLMNEDGTNKKVLARMKENIRAIAFHPNGNRVLFITSRGIHSVDIHNGEISIMAEGGNFQELDIDNSGKLLVATEKILGGYRVVTINTVNNSREIVAKGCSASISPDGSLISVNSHNHRQLYLYSQSSNTVRHVISMIDKKKFDNQYWSNNNDWLSSRSEGDEENIYLHYIPTASTFQITFSGRCDRPDFFTVDTK